jgi:hypothetical protein
MSSDLEELAREGMRQFTATMRVSPDLAARTCQRHRRRARRRLTGLAAGAAAVAAGAAVAVTALTPASPPPRAQLAAWTVVEHSDGNITVTISQLLDPAALQGMLRADGVPASVTFAGQQNPACQPYPGGAGTGLFGQVVQHMSGQVVQQQGQPKQVAEHRQGQPEGAGQPKLVPHRQGQANAMTIDRSALPSGAGLQISATNVPGAPAPGFMVSVGLVSASPQCTGS